MNRQLALSWKTTHCLGTASFQHAEGSCLPVTGLTWRPPGLEIFLAEVVAALRPLQATYHTR